MIATEVTVGERLEFELERDGSVHHMRSVIEGSAWNKIYVSAIDTTIRAFRFEPSDKVRVIYRSGERLWTWKDATGGVETVDGNRMHVVYVKGKAESFNRRNAYRVKTGENINFCREVYEEDAARGLLICKSREKFDGMVCDISEEGIGIVTTFPLNEEDFLSFLFPVDGKMMECEAKVVRGMPLPDESIKQLYGCRLLKTGKEWSKFVTETQRKQLQNLRGGR